MEEVYYLFTAGAAILVSALIIVENNKARMKLTQARKLIDLFDDSLNEESPGGEQITKLELKGIVAALKTLLS